MLKLFGSFCMVYYIGSGVKEYVRWECNHHVQTMNIILKLIEDAKQEYDANGVYMRPSLLILVINTEFHNSNMKFHHSICGIRNLLNSETSKREGHRIHYNDRQFECRLFPDTSCDLLKRISISDLLSELKSDIIKKQELMNKVLSFI